MAGYVEAILRIFRRRLGDDVHLDEEEIAMVLGCLLAAITEVWGVLIDEVTRIEP